MESYKRCSHTVWDCKYHVVWVTKYRYPVLGGDVGQRCRELLRETATGARDGSSRRIDQSRPRAFVALHSIQSVGVACGAIPEGAKFPQAAGRVCQLAQTLLGSAPVGTGLLGCKQWKRDG